MGRLIVGMILAAPMLAIDLAAAARRTASAPGRSIAGTALVKGLRG